MSLVDTENSITLTPTATLRWGKEQIHPWQAGLFELGASRRRQLSPEEFFWSLPAKACITTLYRVANPDNPSADDAKGIADIPLPESAALWLEQAPPLRGGEYLNEETLAKIWKKLLQWCSEEVRSAGGLSPFLLQQAPLWQQVGRIFFHLAENRLNPHQPFAFLATFSIGLNDQGQPKHTPLATAIKHYNAQKDNAALRKLLAPVLTAASQLDWVQKMVANKTIFRPEPLTSTQAYTFLQTTPVLEECGIGVYLPNWWKQRNKPKVQVSLSSTGTLSASSLITFDVQVALGDTVLTAQEIKELLTTAKTGLVLYKGQWIEVDHHKLEQALQHWRKVATAAKKGQISFFEGMRMLAGMGYTGASAEELEEIKQWSYLHPGAGFQELLQGARGALVGEDSVIEGLHATLRPYQRYGVRWMDFLGHLGLGACLADDMGLGKTMQVLALLLKEKAETSHKFPSLLIAPASLLTNWKAEAEKFAPSLNLLLVHPSELKASALKALATTELDEYDLVLTTYMMITRLTWLQNKRWQRIILDEAQAIKNAATKQSRTIRSLKAPIRLALTGTPIENNLTDLWTLFDFLNPGLLGSAKEFADIVATLKNDSKQGLAPLRRVTSPYILRRMKTDKSIISCLPEKTEVPLYCHLTKEQARLYAEVTEEMARALQSVGRKEGQRRMVIMKYILLLKQICNHPAQAGAISQNFAAYEPQLSGKFKTIGELCADIASRQEKVLVFTQLREIIPALVHYLMSIFKQPGLCLHGATPIAQRRSLVESFQRDDGPPFFVISLKAGGTGLTLTQASHVLHFDRWWNPAVEDQATDRAFRIGQKNNVLVHKCITLGTLEEKIDGILQSKKSLASEMLDGLDSNLTTMSDSEILNLVRLDVRRATE